MKHHERDESHDNSLAITTATPKIREFVPKGEWREEGLGHYDPLSIPNYTVLGMVIADRS